MTASEEEKRLIVVLIATNKILTPLLRDRVPKEIKKLWSFLTDHVKSISKSYELETLTYSIYRRGRHFKSMAFQNINKNHEIKTRKKGKGKKKSKEMKYDYSIKSLVDLAKLYLPSSNAKYMKFGDSMDLSAALNLLGYNKYPTPVFVSSNPSLGDMKSLANEFRITVRNPGAHFIEKSWTEHFMNQCFEKLEALVKALVPADQEKETLDQLHLWKTKGRDLIKTGDLSYLMKTFSQNQDANLHSSEHTKQLLFILETRLAHFDDMETRVYSEEKCLDSTEKHIDDLHRFLTEVFEKKKKIQAENDFSEEASHMNEESGDETCEDSTSSGISKNTIDSSGGRKRSKSHKNEGRKRFKAHKNEEDFPENQLHLERIIPDIVLLQYQNGAPFKIEFTGKLPEGMESGVADFENLEKGVSLVKKDDKTLLGGALPQSLKPGAFKVTVYSEDRRCLGKTTIVYIDLVREVLEQVISCQKATLKFIKAIIACLNVHSEGGTSDGENHTNDGPSGLEKSSLSVQLLQRFIYAAAKVNAVWFIRLIFDLPAGRIVFDSYKGRPLLPEYVARARGHNEIAEYLEDVTKRYSGSEITDEERCNAKNWQEIVTAIEATQESLNSSTEGVFKETVSSHNQENFLEATKVVYTDLTDETLEQAVICLKTMLQFLQAAIPCLNVHSEGGTSDRENHTNDAIVGPSGWEKPSLSVQLLQRFIYAAAKVNAVWFIRLIFDLPAGRIVFDSYKGRPLLPEYVARARGHNEIAEYLEDVTKRYSESERTDEKFNVVNWQEIVTAIEATQENPNSFSETMKTGKNTDSHEARCDDWKSGSSSQQVRGKKLRSNFSDEQLNYFKFVQIVITEFPRALRQTFRTMWDNKFGNMTGFKPWDDSPDVRNLFLNAEGGKTRVPTHLSYEEWDFVALIQATIHARSFTGPDSKGQRRKLPHGKFHASVVSPVGYDLESSLHAIHQLRLLRNLFCHSLKAEIDKATFDHFVQQAKEAFIALGIATDEIDAIASTASDWFPWVPCEVEGGIRQEILADVERFGGCKRKLKRKIDDLEQEHDKRTIVGPSGREKSSLSVQLLQRFIYAAAKVNAVWFIRLIFDLPAGRIVFDSYKGRPLLPEYVARARGHNEIAEYLEDVTNRYSGSERTDEEKCNVIDWQEIVTAIEATQENPKDTFKETVSSHNREKFLEETIVADTELIEETLKQAISFPKMMLQFIQVAIPCLNVRSEGGASDGENHTNGGPSGWEKPSLSVQLLQRFVYAAAKVNAVWFIRLIFDLPAGRIVFDSYKGRPLLPEYVARARGHNEIAEYLEDVTKRYSGSERTDEEKCNVIKWQEIVTAIEATQENPNSFSEIMKTGEKTAPSQKVREKERRSNLSDKQLNYFKFVQIVTTEFPRALRQTFRTMWDNKFGNMTGFRPWDDSPDVRKLFLKAEGGKTRVPTHLSYEEWDFFALTHATIHARSFAKPDSKGQRRKLPHGKFHASVMSPVGYDLESSFRAIHQLRLMRNLFCHSLKAEIDKETFDHFVQQAKEAFIALGIATDKIDAIALKESDSPPPVPCEVEDGIRQEVVTDVKYLEGFRGNKSEEIIKMLKQKIEDLQQEHYQTIKLVGLKNLIFQYMQIG